MEKVTSTATSAAQAVSKAIFGDSTNKDEATRPQEVGHTQRAGDTSRPTGDSLAHDSRHDESSTGGKFHHSDSAAPMRHQGEARTSAFEEGGPGFHSGLPDTHTSKPGLTGGLAAGEPTAKSGSMGDRTAGSESTGRDHISGSDSAGGDHTSKSGLTASEKLERHLHGDRATHPNADDPTIHPDTRPTTHLPPGGVEKHLHDGRATQSNINEPSTHRDDRPQTTTSNIPGLNPGAGLGHDREHREHIPSSSTHDNSGPHKSNVANKLDPRVDSDRDHRDTTTTGGVFSSGSHDKTTHGPHSNDVSNKADPRVDSDRDHRESTTHHDTGSNNPFRSDRTEVHRAHDHSKGGLMAASGLPAASSAHHKNDGPHDSNVANKADPRVDSDHDHRGAGIALNAGPHQSHTANKADPRVDSDRDHRGAAAGGLASGTHHSLSPADSGDVRSVDAPAGPTHTEMKTTAAATNYGSSSPSNPLTGRPGESSGAPGITGSAGNDTSAHKSTVGHGTHEPNTLTGSGAGGPGAQVMPSIGADPSSGVSPHHKQQQGSSRPMDDPTSTGAGPGRLGEHRKSIPLVEGHPESGGPKTHPEGHKLPSAPGTGQGTGTQHVKSSGVAAEGGDFDAAAPGAGHEADRLLEEKGIHHGPVEKKPVDTTPGKPSIGTDTAHSGHKPSLGERIKEKLHVHPKH